MTEADIEIASQYDLSVVVIPFLLAPKRQLGCSVLEALASGTSK
ncbi:hypothetical protein [Methylomonas rivi]|uniref:Uncharacterized protein n=1 Tax=Methylomonas rivi TaxID=2952226 RepID=A0ABT1U5V4_9GAMM|nr:hypothetical protein [Methylomonas sp. WSC-6]MCQ8129242.1 hypothetical protein [Methylomonas sp. WSC-6]